MTLPSSHSCSRSFSSSTLLLSDIQSDYHDRQFLCDISLVSLEPVLSKCEWETQSCTLFVKELCDLYATTTAASLEFCVSDCYRLCARFRAKRQKKDGEVEECLVSVFVSCEPEIRVLRECESHALSNIHFILGMLLHEVCLHCLQESREWSRLERGIEEDYPGVRRVYRNNCSRNVCWSFSSLTTSHDFSHLQYSTVFYCILLGWFYRFFLQSISLYISLETSLAWEGSLEKTCNDHHSTRGSDDNGESSSSSGNGERVQSKSKMTRNQG